MGPSQGRYLLYLRERLFTPGKEPLPRANLSKIMKMLDHRNTGNTGNTGIPGILGVNGHKIVQDYPMFSGVGGGGRADTPFLHPPYSSISSLVNLTGDLNCIV